MELRDTIRTQVAPLLEPGETVQAVLLARGGLTPWVSNSLGMIGWIFFIKPYVLVYTDRSLAVFKASFGGTTPEILLKRLPRTTGIGPLKGIWARTALDGETIWIHRQFHKDVADTAAAA